jgi:hypothetical protein
MIMPLLIYISFIDQGYSLTFPALAMQAACLCQEEADSVAGSAMLHLLTSFYWNILSDFAHLR